MKNYILLGLFFFSLVTAFAQSPVGVWKTIDDATGEAKSKVSIYEENGKLYGKIIDLLLKPDDTVCKECKGELRNTPVVGLVIIEDLTAYNDYWKNGSILDPESGSTYNCSIWFEDGKNNELKVRGKHWTGIYRTQTWYKAQ